MHINGYSSSRNQAFSITQMTNKIYWDFNDRRRLGSDDKEQNPDDHCGVFVIEFMRMERGSDIINVFSIGEEPVVNMIRLLHGLDEIPP